MPSPDQNVRKNLDATDLFWISRIEKAAHNGLVGGSRVTPRYSDKTVFINKINCHTKRERVGIGFRNTRLSADS